VSIALPSPTAPKVRTEKLEAGFAICAPAEFWGNWRRSVRTTAGITAFILMDWERIDVLDLATADNIKWQFMKISLEVDIIAGYVDQHGR
jgi:hypothetical protein